MRRRSARKFNRIARRVENFLLRALIVVLLLLLIGQSLVQFDATRSIFSYVYRLEGQSYPSPDPNEPEAVGATYLSPAGVPLHTVSIMLVSLPGRADARLLIDGFAVATFEDARVTVEVHEGDRLEIDSVGIPDPLRFRVVDTSPDLILPRQGTELLVENERALITVVRAR